MGSGRQTFVKKELCPVLGRTVSLKGMRVSRNGQSVVAKSTCSNISNCIETHCSTDKIPECLLHKLV